MENKVFYVTTPIYYPSDKLHIGHALTTTMADTLARYKKMRGYDVYFLTGSDEHGQKIQRKAQEAGVEPLTYVDRIVASFQELWRRLDIQYNDFIRTTEGRHKRVVQELFRRIYEQGDIYKSEYEGWYCTPCETFWTERQLVEGNCPDCGRPVELLREESYFFRLSKYADRLLEYIEEHPEFIQPPSRRNEMINFIKGGLEDLCVSRTTFDWGIPVPFDSRHVIYVWFDALTNYISALGYGTEDDSLFRRYWPGAVHLVGKDIVRFHTIIWPIILMAAGIELPRQVFGHGWLLVEGGKMSKSKGNVVDPMILIERYGSDAIRYFLLREMPYGNDGYYSEEALVNRINTDLANDFGNLLSRTTAMIEKFAGGYIPAPGSEESPLDRELKSLAARVPEEVDRALNNFEFAKALSSIWELINRANKYIEETAPWSLARRSENRERLNTVLYNLAEAIRQATVMCTPFMPGVPRRVWQQLGIAEKAELHAWDSLAPWGGIPAGIKIARGEPLFPRLEWQGEGAAPAVVCTKNGESDRAESSAAGKEGEELISIEEFGRIKLRVAQVLAAERVPKADKLLKLEVKLGDERRTVVAGIAKYYRPEDLVGKKVILVANLKPAKLRGIVSEGMVLAAVDGDNLALLTTDAEITDGAVVR